MGLAVWPSEPGGAWCLGRLAVHERLLACCRKWKKGERRQVEAKLLADAKVPGKAPGLCVYCLKLSMPLNCSFAGWTVTLR